MMPNYRWHGPMLMLVCLPADPNMNYSTNSSKQKEHGAAEHDLIILPLIFNFVQNMDARYSRTPIYLPRKANLSWYILAKHMGLVLILIGNGINFVRKV